MGLQRMLSSGGLDSAYQLSPSVQGIVDREHEVNVNTPKTQSKLKRRWLRRLRSMTCMMSRGLKEENVGSCGFGQVQGTRIRRVRVRHCQRRLKELSALFTGQEIQAHEGSIIAMKFSHDGQYLASAGEDKIVRVWKVVEDERLDTVDIPDADPSCVYFSVNHLSESGPLMVEKDKLNKSKSLRRTQDSACIVFPSKVFRIFEKPLHVFHGHSGEILDLSWSKDNCLLSSSVDKTVRLWRVGVDQCLKVFQHSDYVTCIQFNPVNDDYFISGSIDGKVRIWSIGGYKVVDWVETRDIVTAVSYHPDGQAGIIGSIAGTCHLFHLSDNHFQLGAQMCLTSKKKSPCKRITGFQFSPQDPSKILVTSADSKVRIIDGVNVIGKYRGPRNAGNQSCASFTSDGNHIVSASDDSNVYIWNYSDQGESASLQSKSIRSYEYFSSDASVAISWPGLKTGNSEDLDGLKSDQLQTNSLPFSSPTSLSLGQRYFLDSSSKGSATWPEEKLPVSSPQTVTSPISKSQFKLLKTSCQSASDSHSWGLVIVTSGWDGRIRSFHNYGLPPVAHKAMFGRTPNECMRIAILFAQVMGMDSWQESENVQANCPSSRIAEEGEGERLMGPQQISSIPPFISGEYHLYDCVMWSE
ncbi:Transducin/WD40 repeat-like superfamily protein [Perilla frutescens var. hirtella]|nr:Transducin/WD40 repeat-like superfamily protein [Perilla frutescens var. hirtella]KAH6815431.1 Transducin/WD40 repeat-like superfamily protein [Perilla frutescens var. frutescens]